MQLMLAAPPVAQQQDLPRATAQVTRVHGRGADTREDRVDHALELQMRDLPLPARTWLGLAM